MIADEQQIERIVRQVLDQVGRLSADDVAPAVPVANAASSCSPEKLVLTASVVTLDTLDRKLDGIKHVVVTKRAVVTPAARDALADRGIELKRCDSITSLPDTQNPSTQIVIGATDNASFEQSAKSLSDSAAGADLQPVGSLVESVTALCKKLEAPDSAGVLLTEQAVTAMCLANRYRHIRAIHATDAGTVRDAVKSIGANLLVIDPRSTSDFQMKRVVQALQQTKPVVRCSVLNRALEEAR